IGKCKVVVRIHQPRKNRQIRQVNYLSTSRYGNIPANFLELSILDQDDLVCRDSASDGIDNATCFHRCDAGCGCCVLSYRKAGAGDDKSNVKYELNDGSECRTAEELDFHGSVLLGT